MVRFDSAVLTILTFLAGAGTGVGAMDQGQGQGKINSMSRHGNMMRHANASGRNLRRSDAKTTKGAQLSAADKELFLNDHHSRTLYARRHRHLQTSIGWKPVGNEISAAPDADFDMAGSSISTNADGTRVAIGSYNHSNGQGHVRVFDLVDDSWNQVGLDIDGVAGGDNFGSSLSLSNDGKRLAIGAPNHANYMGMTRVYEYDADSDSWVGLGMDIDGLSSNDKNGGAVSLSGDGETLGIGAPEAGGGTNFFGYARVFKYDATQSRWTQFGNSLEGTEYYHTMGTAMALNEDGTRFAVAGKFHPFSGKRLAGAVWVYQLDNTTDPASPQWVPMGEGVYGSTYYELLGDSIDINAVGDRIAVGASNNDDSGFSNAGKAMVFQWLEDGNEWVQLGSSIFGIARGDALGKSVSISAIGDRIAVGSPNFDVVDLSQINIGQARIYDYIFDDTPGKDEFDWVQVGNGITGECHNDASSRALDMSKDGKRVAIGAPLNDYYNGHARVFEATEGFVESDETSCFTFPPTPLPTSSPTKTASAAPSATPKTGSPTKIASAEPTGLPTSSPSASPSATPTVKPTGVPTLSPSSSPTAHPSNAPSEKVELAIEPVLIGFTLEGSCECSQQTTAVLTAYLETTWATTVPDVDLNVRDVQCVGICADSRGPGDRLEFLIDATQSVPLVNSELLVDPAEVVNGVNLFLAIGGGTAAIAAQTGLPITGASAKIVSFPSAAPSAEVTISPQPTMAPSASPTKAPTSSPSKNPTGEPTPSPTGEPTASPSSNPTDGPTVSHAPTVGPTKNPSKAPTPATTSGAAGVFGCGSLGLSTMLASVSVVVFLVLN